MNESGNVPVSCVVLTLNEELNLPAALRSLAQAEQVVIVDSGSVDETIDLAYALGAEVLENPWPGYAKQRNWALLHPMIRHDWILFVDADEQIRPDGWREIETFVADPADHRAADFRRTVRLFDRELKHGGFSSARVTRLLHRDYGHFLERPVHEHAVVKGSVHHMSIPIVHEDRKPFADWVERHNRYSSLEAEARLRPLGRSPSGRAAVKQRVRVHLWPRLPARPLLFFLYVYVFRLGFLDGKAGLRIAALYAFQELAVQVKLEELRKAPSAE